MNWGGRGQSIALHQLLERKFEVESVIAGDTVCDCSGTRDLVGTLLPLKHFPFLRRMRHAVKPIDWYVRIEERFGARDFVANDPSKSADNLFRYKSQNTELEQIYS